MKTVGGRAGELAQQLRALATVTRTGIQIPQIPLTPVPRDPTASPGLSRYIHTSTHTGSYTHMHT